MPQRINRAIELLEQDQPIYYTGFSAVSYDAGLEMAGTHADYINVSMEHGTFDLPGLDSFMKGLKAAGPTRSGHPTPAVIADLPPDGSSEAVVRANAWLFEQVLDRGVHGILLCHAESPEAVAALVEECRYSFQTAARDRVPQGRRGNGGQGSAAAVWGVTVEEYLRLADFWPLNPEGELMLGLKIENRRAVENVEATLKVPGIAFAEWGPGDNHWSHGEMIRAQPYSAEMMAIRQRVKDACDANGIAFLDGASEDNIRETIDEGVRIISAPEEAAAIGRKHTGRRMPV